MVGWPVRATDYTSAVIIENILQEWHKTGDGTTNEADISSVFKIITENVQRRKVVAKWVHPLNDGHKANSGRIIEEVVQCGCGNAVATMSKHVML